MSGPEFWQTPRGHVFYESTVPRIADALEEIAARMPSMERMVAEHAEMAEFVKRIAATTVGHSCVPLTGRDGSGGFCAEAQALLTRMNQK